MQKEAVKRKRAFSHTQLVEIFRRKRYLNIHIEAVHLMYHNLLVFFYFLSVQAPGPYAKKMISANWWNIVKALIQGAFISPPPLFSTEKKIGQSAKEALLNGKGALVD